jgi:hypothetical protein
MCETVLMTQGRLPEIVQHVSECGESTGVVLAFRPISVVESHIKEAIVKKADAIVQGKSVTMMKAHKQKLQQRFVFEWH